MKNFHHRKLKHAFWNLTINIGRPRTLRYLTYIMKIILNKIHKAECSEYKNYNCSEVISKINSVRYLGLFIDERLKCYFHISQTNNIIRNL